VALTDDDLPVSEVGEWAFEKHDRLRRYVDIARGVGKALLAKRARPTSTYILALPDHESKRQAS
jgi:hypothetical protein